MRSNRVAFRVLTNRSLFQSIVAFSAGVPYFVFQVKEQLECARNEDSHLSADIKLWKKALCSGDKRTLEALATLSKIPVLGERLDKVLKTIMGFALSHTKDLELLDWIYDAFPSDAQRRCTLDQHELLGEQGGIEVVRWLLDHESLGHCGFPDIRQSRRCWQHYSGIALHAAKFGRMELLRFLHDSGRVYFSHDVMDAAAASGQLAVVQFLHENRGEGCSRAAFEGAAENGHLDVLQFLHETRGQDFPLRAIELAARHGQVECLHYMREATPNYLPREDLVNFAAAHGQLECIKYFHANDYFRFSPKAMHKAAINGHLAIVKFLHENRTEGCKVDTLFECDKRELRRILEFLCTQRPMKSPEKAIAKAKREGRTLLAVRLAFENSAAAKQTYLYR